MGSHPPTTPNDGIGPIPHNIMNAGVNAVVRAASSGPLPWRSEAPRHQDQPMVIDFARLVHITHAATLAGTTAG